MSDILDRLSDECDLCRNDGADDVADLLQDAGKEISSLRSDLENARDTRNRELGNDTLDALCRVNVAAVHELTAELTAARAEIERLREGLRMYAFSKRWFLNEKGDYVWLGKIEPWTTAKILLSTPPSPASAPESGPTGAERQTDSPGDADGVGGCGK